MSTRTFSLFAGAALLAGCGGPGDEARQRATTPPAPGTGVACARGAATLNAECTVERTPTQDGVILTIRHPDGGFRRLRVTRDGRGVAAADGAEAAKVVIVGPHEIEVTLGSDRYRLPATLGPVPVQAP